MNASQDTLGELDRRAERYFHILNQVFDANWTRDHSPETIESAGAKASAAAQEARDHLNDGIDPICDSYLRASDDERAALRAAIAEFPNLLQALRQYIGWSQRRINTNEDRIHLRRALAAASLEDNRVNYKEMYLALGSLYETCVQAGIQPSMEFVKIGYMSNAERNKGISMRDFLSDFEQSAFFKADVEPKLPKCN